MDRLGRFENSGLTVAAFCQQERVSTASFYLWRRRLRDSQPQAETPSTAVQAVAPRFLPVVLSGASPLVGGFGPPAALELELPNQVRLRMAHGIEARFVGELLIASYLRDVLNALAAEPTDLKPLLPGEWLRTHPDKRLVYRKRESEQAQSAKRHRRTRRQNATAR